MTRKFLQTIGDDSSDNPAVPPGDYTVEVTEARALEGKKVMFLDLKIVGGPDDGFVTSVSLYVPEDGEKAVYHFRKKTRGFAQQLAGIDANTSDDEMMDAIADALVGAVVDAKLGVQTKGDYAGSQELLETKAAGAPTGTLPASGAVSANDPAGVVTPKPVAAAPAPDQVAF